VTWDDIKVILATDCGSTTTKAILIEEKDGEYRLATRGEAPTTVEAPYEDVTVGVRNAVTEVEELSGRQLLDEAGRIIRPAGGQKGTDIYVSTSSAGGGLQVMVVGLVRRMTAESAQRAALGAGAIVMDVLALDDGRLAHQRIERMRELRPDMILISGGVDGGEQRRVVEMAELVGAANPQARLGAEFKLPVIYAGNIDARPQIQQILADATALTIVDNLRPTLEREQLGPARAMIQEQFLDHVMSQAPGYAELINWTDADIMPTPAAVGNIMQDIANQQNINVVGVDIGGATTDVFSVFDGVFNRTVSANLGMSYSIANVVAEVGLANILRWLGEPVESGHLADRIRNKMIRPTTIPQGLEGLRIEQAVAREALRLAFQQHKMLATGLKGIQQERDIAEAFTQVQAGEQTLVDMMQLDLLVGSGGILSHAPRRVQAAMMLIDGFRPEGLTRLAVDSIFMMPQLGVLAQVHPQAARQVFQRDCLVHLGTCLAPVGQGRSGAPCVQVVFTDNGRTISVPFGQLRLIELPEGESRNVAIDPTRQYDVGAGRGHSVTASVAGGVVGLIIDTRGRPLELPPDPVERQALVQSWEETVGLYGRR